ncbi:protein-tyrosine phosphatase [Microbacterium testaceum]|jgi:protein-tyrosine phosphatase|nr:protein-tyrosine phosphatase [Microbacterium testaceum]
MPQAPAPRRGRIADDGLVLGIRECLSPHPHPRAPIGSRANEDGVPMIEIMTVCTGNVCRSPLAATMLATRLADLDVKVTSAGTYGLQGESMTDETKRLAAQLAVDPALIEGHRATYLTEAHLRTPDLILAMSREHRRRIVELNPARLRSTLTLREFARLAAEVPDADIVGDAAAAGDDDSRRLKAAIDAVTGVRGLTPPPADPADDDIVDPYRRSWETYELTASQLAPAVEQVVRVVRLALTR